MSARAKRERQSSGMHRGLHKIQFGASGHDKGLVDERRRLGREKPYFFQEGLLDKLINEMVAAETRGDDVSYLFGRANAALTLEERVAKWKFGELDRNNNGVGTSQ